MTEVSAGCRDLFFQGGCKIKTEVSASSQELPFYYSYLLYMDAPQRSHLLSLLASTCPSAEIVVV